MPTDLFSYPSKLDTNFLKADLKVNLLKTNQASIVQKRADQNIQNLHQRALNVSGQYRKCEGELIDLLQELDRLRGYLQFGASSLYDYCVNQLKLSEGAASNLITVARKAKEVPALKTAIQSGAITVSKARRIAPVLTKTNQDEWLKLAQTQTSRQIEKAVATAQPQMAIRETAKYKAADRIERVVGVSEALNQMIERVMDLESQRLRCPAKFEDALLTMTKLYLEKNDPLKKAERAQKAKGETTKVASSTQQDTKHGTCRTKPLSQTQPKRRYIRSAIVHAVTMRDQRQCTHRGHDGKRCPNTRWLEVHHIKPVAEGGLNTLENLTTLCSAHHGFIHRSGKPNGARQSVLT